MIKYLKEREKEKEKLRKKIDFLLQPSKPYRKFCLHDRELSALNLAYNGTNGVQILVDFFEMPYKNIKTRIKIVTMPLLAKKSLSLYCDLSVWTKMAIQPIFVMTSVKLKYSIFI